ncbi:hypothetical protein R1flu_018357 [Riccia fluitans]|uniref:Exocyst complex component Sec8 n=1 Tax=Riccia fluitans TaxID=41844 RepID=A0ABD1ZJ22_9MARC
MERFEKELTQFVNDVRSLEIEHQLSSKAIAILSESLSRYRKTIGECEAIKKLGPSVLTDRFVKYLQAQGWHEDTARSVDLEINQGLTELRVSTYNARQRIEGLKDMVTSVEQDVGRDLTSKLQNLFLETPSAGDEADIINLEMLELPMTSSDPGHLQYVLHMAVICQMLHEDVEMKEKIVGALGLDTIAEHMEVYSSSWALRPFVDEEIMESALKVLDPRNVSHKI